MSRGVAGRIFAITALLLAATVAGVACSGEETGSQAPLCPAGDQGCPCLPDGTCSPGDGAELRCEADSTCQPAQCVRGDLGCPCFGNRTCNRSPGGAQLVCGVDDLCAAPPECPTGDLGCPCYGNSTCGQGADGGDLVCGRDGTCALPPECPVGGEGCPCGLQGACDLLADSTQLVCGADERCQRPAACPDGSEGCSCGVGGACDTLPDGTQLQCGEESTCERPAACTVGSEGCTCGADDVCDVLPDGTQLVCRIGRICERPPECPVGSEGCPCGPEDECDLLANRTQLVCGQGSLCEQPPPCPAGSEGCPCFGNRTCAAVPDGTQLVCGPDDLCALPAACPVGSQGCPCGDEQACGVLPDGTQLVCDGDGLCQPPPACPAGTLGCACFDNRTCSVQPDGTQLVCGVDALCVLPPPCPAGSDGCPCFANDTCDPGLECLVDGDAVPVCGEPACPAGAEGCVCRDDEPGCDDELLCQQGVCQPLICTPGSAGCACDELGECVGADAYCDDDFVCQIVDCPAGAEGCACAAGGECGLNARGEALSCVAGLCAAPSCVPGDTGCVCAQPMRCHGAGARCQDGFCMPSECPPGSEGCPCAGGGCAAGLMCRDGVICADGTGLRGGPCYPDGTCGRGNRCQGGVCLPCLLGSQACGCDDAQGCHPGLECMAGLCASERPIDERPPEDPRCYTPCLTHLTPERRCLSGNLMEGCVAGRECVDGTCLLPGEQGSPGSCAGDADCPTHQACLDGQCYSNCEQDRHCSAPKVCQLHVCRFPCRTGGEPCPDGTACQSEDGDMGVCMPLAPATEDPPPVTAPNTFSLHRTELTFSPGESSARIVLTNEGDTPQSYRVRKRSMIAYRADGGVDREDDRLERCIDDPRDDCEPLDGDEQCLGFCSPRRLDEHACGGPADLQCPRCNQLIDCPLSWITLTVGDDQTQGDQIEFRVFPRENVTLVISDAQREGVLRWQGSFEVLNEEGLTQTINATYSEVPEGHWSGTAYYFANFGNKRLQEWRAVRNTPEADGLVGQVDNALFQKWAGLKRGNLSWDAFREVLNATVTGSWRLPTVQADCDVHPAGACYPTDDNAVGLGNYTGNLASYPIPTGAVELPFSVFLRSLPEQPGLMEGRIDSAEALQYPGDPRLTLSFVSTSAECDNDNLDGLCLALVADMEAQVFIGGRYATTSGDFACAQGPDHGYELARVPWLVPGFERGTEQDPASGLPYRYECRDTLLPFGGPQGPSEHEVALNASMDAANPIPDGRARRRSLRVVDGALVNQSQLFLIFEERYDPFLPGDSEPIRGYGYMLLHRESQDVDATDDDGDGVPDVYQGSQPVDERVEPDGLLDMRCSPGLLEELLGPGQRQVTDDNAGRLVSLLVSGMEPGLVETIEGSGEEVHYLCKTDGVSWFDGGPGNVTAPGTLAPAELPNDDSCGRPGPDNAHANDCICDDGASSPWLSRNPACAGLGACPLDPDLPWGECTTAICPPGTDASDCGSRTAAELDERVACPAGAEVIYFTVDSTRLSQEELATLPCQSRTVEGEWAPNCSQTLQAWAQAGPVGSPLRQVDPTWRCDLAGEVFCDQDRFDLRAGKIFYAASEERSVLPPLDAAVKQAFRYKTRFQSRTGQTPGFAPQICLPNSDQIPYCYDPPAIEAQRERVDCLLEIWSDHYDAVALAPAPPQAPGEPVNASPKELLDSYLCRSFAGTAACPGSRQIDEQDGFERLYAELFVMMGDEAYTRAFASRFDLAGVRARAFEGSLFEYGGFDLAGVAGHEMHSLYLAAQYYQEALDRFYALSPTLWRSLAHYRDADGHNFVTPETVTLYLERLMRASTQKARAWSQVAKRYQSFNRPELARRVVERAYIATYLESILVARFMVGVTDTLRREDLPQVARVLEDGQLRIRQALLDMGNVQRSITNELNTFGYPADYIPFPLMERVEWSAFEIVLLRAREKLAVAKAREDTAISRNISFDTDTEEFQAELVRLRNTYETRLMETCGSFEGSDGRIYPAVKAYADLHPEARQYGDPCGLMGTGNIFELSSQMETQVVELRRIRASMDNVLEEVEIERGRMQQQCQAVITNADFMRAREGRSISLQEDLQKIQFTMHTIDRSLQAAQTVAELSACTAGTSTDCPSKAVVLIGYGLVVGGLNAAAAYAEKKSFEKEIEMREYQADTAHWQALQQCDYALIDGNARMATIVLRLKELELEALKVDYQSRTVAGQILEQFNLAKRLQDERAEAQQLAVNVHAARNDPNVRIYRNDAVVNADFSFHDALREAYRATRVYEYYTSQSYAARDRLFLIRLVQYGDYNLENYLTELDNEYRRFEEQYGAPALRVMRVSLMNDILRIPRLDDQGRTLGSSGRSALLAARLTDGSLLDADGYVRMPFPIDVRALSPLTRNHKVAYIEADIQGAMPGSDNLGRLYLRQRGTSTVSALGRDEHISYRFPVRTAVVNPFFGGVRFYAPEVYRCQRLRERPLVNTGWELIFNQRDEEVNQDIPIAGLTDIVLYIYYTDHTEL